eukprot:Amastigsp_a345953_76.p2 type:complete len:158 gc:universal Amastigsp_a345953_76:443-916(+)
MVPEVEALADHENDQRPRVRQRVRLGRRGHEIHDKKRARGRKRVPPANRDNIGKADRGRVVVDKETLEAALCVVHHKSKEERRMIVVRRPREPLPQPNVEKRRRKVAEKKRETRVKRPVPKRELGVRQRRVAQNFRVEIHHDKAERSRDQSNVQPVP